MVSCLTLAVTSVVLLNDEDQHAMPRDSRVMLIVLLGVAALFTLMFFILGAIVVGKSSCIPRCLERMYEDDDEYRVIV